MTAPVPALGPVTLAPDALGSLSSAGGSSFRDAVARQLEHVNGLQARADLLAGQFAAGGNVGVHEVMMAAEEAGLGMQLALQVRNRALEAFQEIMRTQV